MKRFMRLFACWLVAYGALVSGCRSSCPPYHDDQLPAGIQARAEPAPTDPFAIRVRPLGIQPIGKGAYLYLQVSGPDGVELGRGLAGNHSPAFELSIIEGTKIDVFPPEYASDYNPDRRHTFSLLPICRFDGYFAGRRFELPESKGIVQPVGFRSTLQQWPDQARVRLSPEWLRSLPPIYDKLKARAEIDWPNGEFTIPVFGSP